MTRISTIRLLGFQTSQSIKYCVFVICLIIYCIVICGNLLIITLVSYSKSLHSPMYFFLAQLSLSDILLITDILPNMLHVILIKEATISFTDCMVQLYFFSIAGMLECLLLTVMSYDRYLAICRPLHYALMMNIRFCLLVVVACWTISIFVMFVNSLTVSMLQFCGPNTIDHFFCDLDPLLDLSCSDTNSVQLGLKLLISSFVVIPFCIIIVSYVYIIVTILKIPSVTGKKRAFSTCSSHLTVVSIYYVTLFCVYLVPHNGQSRNIAKFLSLLYTMVTPLMNPIIYSLRNNDFKKAMKKLVNISVNSVQL
ncbi:olfactory receptor 1M1-like [Mantella aurantiaca]